MGYFPSLNDSYTQMLSVSHSLQENTAVYMLFVQEYKTSTISKAVYCTFSVFNSSQLGQTVQL